MLFVPNDPAAPIARRETAVLSADPLAGQGLARLCERASLADVVSVHAAVWSLPLEAMPRLLVHHAPAETILADARTLRALAPELALVAIPAGTGPLPLARLLGAGVVAVLPTSVEPVDLTAALAAHARGFVGVAAAVIARGASDAAPLPATVDEGVLTGLTPRQRAIAHELATSGMSGKALAARLGIAPGTLKIHASAIYKRVGVAGRSALTAALRREEAGP